MPSFFEKIATDPKQLFLIDGIGALISAFFLGVVLVAFEPVFGMPKNVLYSLASIPCVFAVYSFGCYFLLQRRRKLFLRGIAIANLMYCLVTLWLLYLHNESLTAFGKGYFILELLILGILIWFELKSAANN